VSGLLKSAGLRSIVTLTMLLMLLSGCKTVELNGVQEMLDHPQFPVAAKAAPDWTRAVLKKLADTEARIESQ
tara:strand:- start:281 stop:496 length:216 start_codon:yes stop_codon:yes gene_type:complete